MTQNKIKIGITQGDINGIGYEVIIKALSDSRMTELFTPVIYGSPKVAAYHKKVLNFETFHFNQVRSASEADHYKVNIVNCCDDNVRVELGKSSSHAGEAAYLALEQAINDLKNGEIDALVTAPVNKENIQSEAFNFPGHTEYLAQLFDTKNPLMLLISDNLRVGVATGHLPLKDVPAAITKELILSKLKTLHYSLVSDFACTNPRIAVLGLNPHAGDNGVIGNEENEVIIPAIQSANQQGITALGPFAADGFFGDGNWKHFDGVLAMYHDQGLAPFKVLAMEDGVNYTGGLPVVRTSPAHGTAYEIAGKNQASETSFRSAIYTAIDIARHRREERVLHRDPLQKQFFDKRDDSHTLKLDAPEEGEA
ncbi:MAG TPA: 4-hydroxythreonine-4-phosphate dehydrogenase PdxA [Prolixibacteraceae bacterium]|nr:4-hydroxythreonine-4-phosphate dehydrogenase PdxA [Prolixibacteraceae bacterium]